MLAVVVVELDVVVVELVVVVVVLAEKHVICSCNKITIYIMFDTFDVSFYRSHNVFEPAKKFDCI